MLLFLEDWVPCDSTDLQTKGKPLFFQDHRETSVIQLGNLHFLSSQGQQKHE